MIRIYYSVGATGGGGDGTPGGSSGQIQYNNAGNFGGISSTGTGDVVRASGATMTDPVVGTQTAGDNSTKAASTAYVDTALAGVVQVLAGEVATFADLPAAASHTSENYLVRTSTGVYFVNRKVAGIYTSNGSAWIFDGDSTEAYFQDTLAWTNITSKPATFPPVIGSGAGDAVAGNDSRLTNERVPSAAGLTTKFGTNKATVVDGDKITMLDSAASDAPVHILWSLVKSTLKTYFDGIYLALVVPGTSGNVLTSNGSAWTSAAPSGGGGGTKTYAVFTPLNNQPPSSAYATLDTRNSVAVLDFDDTTEEAAIFNGVMVEAASLASGLKIRINWAATSATSGDCRWGVAIQRGTTDIDSDSFDTAVEATTTCSGTSGITVVTEITITTIDSLAAGEWYRLKVYRDVTDGADTMAGDAEVVAVEVRSAA